MQMSGYLIFNNTFINCEKGSFIGGGRRNRVLNNTYHNCSISVHEDNRGMNWQEADCKEVHNNVHDIVHVTVHPVYVWSSKQ